MLKYILTALVTAHLLGAIRIPQSVRNASVSPATATAIAPAQRPHGKILY